MANSVDEKYIKSFKSKFIKHLADRGLRGENNPSGILRDANSQGTGKLTRIFDSLKLPVLDRESCLKAIEKAGGIDKYCFAMVEELAPVIMNDTRTALNRDVIEKGIGLGRYADLIGSHICKVEKGVITVIPGKELDFKKKEGDIAKAIMQATLVNYSLLITPQVSKSQNNRLNEQDTSFSENVVIPIGKLTTMYQPIGMSGKQLTFEQQELEKEITDLSELINEAKIAYSDDPQLIKSLTKLEKDIKGSYDIVEMVTDQHTYMNERTKAIVWAAELRAAVGKFANSLSENLAAQLPEISESWEDKKIGVLFRIFKFIITAGMSGWYSKEELAKRDEIIDKKNMRAGLVGMVETVRTDGCDINSVVTSFKHAKEAINGLKDSASKSIENEINAENKVSPIESHL